MPRAWAAVSGAGATSRSTDRCARCPSSNARRGDMLRYALRERSRWRRAPGARRDRRCVPAWAIARRTLARSSSILTELVARGSDPPLVNTTVTTTVPAIPEPASILSDSRIARLPTSYSSATPVCNCRQAVRAVKGSGLAVAVKYFRKMPANTHKATGLLGCPSQGFEGDRRPLPVVETAPTSSSPRR